MSDTGITENGAGVGTARKARLRAEFAGLFVAAPVVMAVLLPPSWMFPALFAVTGVGLVLLHITPGFTWGSLVAGSRRIDWRLVAVVAMATAAAGTAIVMLTAPHALFYLPLNAPMLMLTIAAFYPVVSALPQEIVFRPLFFRRYEAILPGGLWPGLVLNAAVFSFAHLMYWSWIVAAMTFAGGLVFGWSYRAKGNFPEAVVLHAVAGVIVFVLGLGVFFYSGNVTRPF